MILPMHRWTLVIVLVLACSAVRGAEITSNGSGGGDWSNPGTWIGRKAPGPDDDAVIQKGDIVDFDRDDSGKVSCQKLFIDPRGAFRLKPGIGKATCCVAGPIESRGVIQIDASKNAGDTLELRVVGTEAAKRSVKLLKGASLILRGRGELPEDRRNALLTSPKIGEQKEEMECAVHAAKGGVLLDVQRAELDNIFLRADDLDNTGARANERVNIVENRFRNRGRIYLTKCDTPAIRKNAFHHPGTLLANAAGILVSECPLSEIRGNTVQGFHYGVQAGHPDGATIVGNTVEKCTIGFHAGFGRNNSIYQNTARDCERAFDFHYTQMANLEDNRAEGCKIAVRSLCSVVQVATLEISKMPKDGVAVLYDADAQRCEGNVVLVNCNIAAEQVKLAQTPKLGPQAPPPVMAMYCMVVGVKDTPPGTVIDVKTVNPMPPLAPGAIDPNVRNAPAPLSKGLTPVPRPAGTPRDALPIMVKAWTIDVAGKTIPAPEYDVRVQTPDARVVKSVRVKPEEKWFRAKPDDPTPTVEVNLK